MGPSRASRLAVAIARAATATGRGFAGLFPAERHGLPTDGEAVYIVGSRLGTEEFVALLEASGAGVLAGAVASLPPRLRDAVARHIVEREPEALGQYLQAAPSLTVEDREGLRLIAGLPGAAKAVAGVLWRVDPDSAAAHFRSAMKDDQGNAEEWMAATPVGETARVVEALAEVSQSQWPEGTKWWLLKRVSTSGPLAERVYRMAREPDVSSTP